MLHSKAQTLNLKMLYTNDAIQLVTVTGSRPNIIEQQHNKGLGVSKRLMKAWTIWFDSEH